MQLGTTLLAMIVGSVAMSALAQVLLRFGMSRPPVQLALSEGGAWPVAWAIGTSPGVVAGLGLYGVGAIVWLFVLARVPVSLAYAFVSLGFLLTMALGCLALGEPLTARKLAGTALVALGVWLVATSGG
ncbi:small multi-drug resistant family protein [Falsiroseomonas sp.]|uniref:small multi-drug resistant family protein n=1 Tax=Falsiroseomonas sp. TaxID=2870721 RepID=UPI003564E8D0